MLLGKLFSFIFLCVINIWDLLLQSTIGNLKFMHFFFFSFSTIMEEIKIINLTSSLLIFSLLSSLIKFLLLLKKKLTMY